QTVEQQLKSGQISFADACAKYSVLPNRDKGGDAGPVEWNKLNPEWSDRLTKMKPGTVSDIFMNQGFKTQVYLFKPGGGAYRTMTLEEATPMITDILRQPKSKDRFEDYAASLKKKAVIDIRL
ncbi:MAG: peptidylprolyl isomerase, partial [Desulfovibrio sp.]|nr:peptidylprolyl isomerase [Desulfovibrio sp.]